MEYSQSIIRNRKLKFILITSFLFLCIGSYLYMIFIGYIDLLFILLGIGLLGLIITSILSAKLYSWPVLSFLLVFLGMYFKKQHWPFAGQLMSLGTLLLGILSLWNSVKFMITFRNNPFLKWIGCIAGTIVTVFMIGLLCGYQHWPGKAVFSYSGCMMFILLVLAIVFTLPNSNYIDWTWIERKVFFRTVLLPMIFVFALITLMFVFPDTFNAIIGRKTVYFPWEISEFELFHLEGIPIY
ncbi:MAG: hypothetical protein NTV31_05710 [Bacteroidia bacterium]|nr:hypothetical protein [Bacteroidia bacterium]